MNRSLLQCGIWYVPGFVDDFEEPYSNLRRFQLKKEFPHLPLPTKSIKRQKEDGWAMLDLGDSVIHIVSRNARAKWFDESREW